MIGRRAVVGLALLSVLLFCALAAQSASAALTTSKNTTAFTCLFDSGAKDFKDAHCDEAAAPMKGNYGHELIPLNTKTTVDVPNTTNAVLKGEVVGGGKVTITCTVVKNGIEKSTLLNTEPELGAHTVTGQMEEIKFTKCTVTELKNCIVKEPIEAKAIVHGVDGMEGPNKEANAMGLEFIGAGKNETFMEITFEGASCVVKGITFPVKGKMIATNGPTTTSKQDKKASGATLVFTNANAMEELTLGGKTATFTLTATLEKLATFPISLTTTT